MTSSSDAQPAKPVADALARRSISAAVNAFQAGLTQIPALPYAIVCMHLGPSVEVTCSRGGRLRHGREVAGDLDIVPARTPSAWETKQSGTSLIIRVPDLLLQDRKLSIAQVAFATGFAHQSHLARHMRKILGVTPAVARNELTQAASSRGT